jgi:hypothetical protein
MLVTECKVVQRDGFNVRLVAFSEEHLRPRFGWLTLGPPLLSALTDRQDATLVSPPPLAWSFRLEWRRAIQQVRRADTMFWLQWSARPAWQVLLLTGAAPAARRAAYVLDPWKPQLTKLGVAALAQRLAPCFVAYREAQVELQSRFPGGRFEWLPCGANTDLFRPGPTQRDIFVYWMGRRFEPLHAALESYCANRGLRYVYTANDVKPPFGEAGHLAGRARYFVVTPPDLDNPERTGGFSPLTMRYLEGLSAGARLIGVLPRSGEFEALLPRDSILEVSPYGHDLAEKLDQDRRDEAVWATVDRTCQIVRRNHSWTARAASIYERLCETAAKLVVAN